MSARYYDSRTGRFLCEDPIGFDGGDENFYRYVKNNPVLLVDPTGLDFRVCSRPLNMSLPNLDPFKHYYIRFPDGSTISYGVDSNGNPIQLPEPIKSPEGEVCGNNISSTKEEDSLMKKWANQNYSRPYDAMGFNCKSFVGAATTQFWNVVP